LFVELPILLPSAEQQTLANGTAVVGPVGGDSASFSLLPHFVLSVQGGNVVALLISWAIPLAFAPGASRRKQRTREERAVGALMLASVAASALGYFSLKSVNVDASASPVVTSTTRLLLLLAGGLGGAVGCASVLIMYPYVSRFSSSATSALSTGMGANGLIAAIGSLAQQGFQHGAAYKPRVSPAFFLACSMALTSLGVVSWLFVQWTSVGKVLRRRRTARVTGTGGSTSDSMHDILAGTESTEGGTLEYISEDEYASEDDEESSGRSTLGGDGTGKHVTEVTPLIGENGSVGSYARYDLLIPHSPSTEALHVAANAGTLDPQLARTLEGRVPLAARYAGDGMFHAAFISLLYYLLLSLAPYAVRHYHPGTFSDRLVLWLVLASNGLNALSRAFTSFAPYGSRPVSRLTVPLTLLFCACVIPICRSQPEPIFPTAAGGVGFVLLYAFFCSLYGYEETVLFRRILHQCPPFLLGTASKLIGLSSQVGAAVGSLVAFVIAAELF
jgi:hypothetical protein